MTSDEQRVAHPKGGRLTQDEQEALSRKHSNDVIILLPLSSGRWAVFNNARELCTIVTDPTQALTIIKNIHWYPPLAPEPHTQRAYVSQPSPINLKDLGL